MVATQLACIPTSKQLFTSFQQQTREGFAIAGVAHVVQRCFGPPPPSLDLTAVHMEPFWVIFRDSDRAQKLIQLSTKRGTRIDIHNFVQKTGDEVDLIVHAVMQNVQNLI